MTNSIIPLFQPGLFVADADLSADRYKYVKSSGAATAGTQVILVAGVTDVAVGILQNKPDAAGKSAKVMVSGISKAIGGGAIAINDPVGPDGAGLADTKVLGVDTTNFVNAQALTAIANANEVVTLLFDCTVPHRAA